MKGSKYSDEQRAAIKASIVSSVERGAPLASAIKLCANEGLPILDYKTIWNWRQADEPFDLAIRDAHATGTRFKYDIAEQTLIQKIQSGTCTTGLLIWALVNWSRKLRSLGISIPVEYVHTMSPVGVPLDEREAEESVGEIAFYTDNGHATVEAEAETAQTRG